MTRSEAMSSGLDAGDIPFITTDQMREVDRIMVEEYGISLVQMMENAGGNLAHLARSRFLGGNAAGRRVLVLAGRGGNGGGGLVCAPAAYLGRSGARSACTPGLPAGRSAPSSTGYS